MNAVLFWKEYRQQRSLWLAILVLAVGVSEALTRYFGPIPIDRYSLGPRVLDPEFALFSLTATYGVISGALLLAAEKEEGTLAFLDSLAGLRTSLWVRKCVAGVVLTVSQGLVVAGLALVLGLCKTETAVWLPLVALDALAWGLLGGSLCSTGMAAVLVGIALMAGSWALGFLWPDPVVLFLIQSSLDLGAVWLSWRIFCREDLTRGVRSYFPIVPSSRLAGQQTALSPHSRHALAWLIARQGRLVLVGGLLSAVLLGWFVQLPAGRILWPVGTLLMGLACGLAVFHPDQDGGATFFAAQRMPPGRIWSWKIAIWSLGLCVMLVLIWDTAGIVYQVEQSGRLRDFEEEVLLRVEEARGWVNNWFPFRDEPGDETGFLLIILWPVYGFCVGQFAGLIARRSIHALFLGLSLSLLLIGFWLPSLFVGGLPAWQPLGVAGLFLVATWLMMRPWMAGRLWSSRPLAGVVSILLLMATCVVGCLWYRTV